MVLDRSVRGVGFYRATFYLPSLLGASVAIAVLWRQIFGADGLVNQLLAVVGIQGPAWVSHPDYALSTLVVLAIWQFGSPMIIFLAGLRQIPQDLYEAASMDGAARLAAVLEDHPAAARAGDLLQPRPADDRGASRPSPRPSSSRAAPAARSTRRCSTRSISTGGLRELPHGLRLGARLAAARHHRDLHGDRLRDVEVLGLLRGREPMSDRKPRSVRTEVIRHVLLARGLGRHDLSAALDDRLVVQAGRADLLQPDGAADRARLLELRRGLDRAPRLLHHLLLEQLPHRGAGGDRQPRRLLAHRLRLRAARVPLQEVLVRADARHADAALPRHAGAAVRAVPAASAG